MEFFTTSNVFKNTGKYFYVNSDIKVRLLDFHTHDFLEIFLVGKGIGIHEVNRRHTSSIIQGDICVIPPGSCHRYEDIDGLQVYNIMLLPEKLGSIWEEISKLPFMKQLINDEYRKYHLPHNIRCQAELILKEIMMEDTRRLPGWSLNLDVLFYKLLILLGRSQLDTPSVNVSDRELGAVYRAVQFIEQNASEPITIRDICRAAQINLNYFCTAFRNAIGTTPWNYLIHIRLEKVKKLLCETDMSIAEAAQESGFCDQSYMSRLFRKYEKITPRQFRNAYNGQKYTSTAEF